MISKTWWPIFWNLEINVVNNKEGKGSGLGGEYDRNYW